MDRLEQIKNTVTANGMREWTDERVNQVAREYATEVTRHNLKRAAEAAKVLVSNGQSHVDVKSWTLEDGIRFSPDYRRITSLEIELI